jgi:carbon storage regulator
MEMLVLSRKDGETIHIGDNVEIKVWLEQGRIRVGIDAPKDVRIMRGELIEKKEVTK